MAGEKVALGFVEQLERAFKHIAGHSATGPSRYAYELDLPGLRFWPLKRYPHLVFYVDSESHIDVWRVLHDERDIPEWMRGCYSILGLIAITRSTRVQPPGSHALGAFARYHCE